MSVPLYHVDAFTDRMFSGNPAAVCLLKKPATPVWMQNVAGDMNLSETAFLSKQGKGFRLRWFTPRAEVKLCGHATLASAHVLWEEGIVPKEEDIHFYTKSGTLVAMWRRDRIELDFPARPAAPCRLPKEVSQAVGVTPKFAGRNVDDFLLEIKDERELRSLSPDFRLLAMAGVRGVIVTCPSDTPKFDFVSRFFAPSVGVNEDPVTGSAHTCLGPYWGEKMHKREMLAFQASARGGVVSVRLRGDRVILGGNAVTVEAGALRGAA